ncbi:MAG TPA: MoaD/ThiS family protein [Pelolinea sp.]|nr:MoaD/ThiS family protein [Pelolinea sp.]
MDTTQVKIEFSSISRVLTGQTELTLDLKAGASIQDVIQTLGVKFPQLLGQIIEKDGKTLIPTNIFSVNGEKIIHESNLKYQPDDGDRLILLSLLSGG